MKASEISFNWNRFPLSRLQESYTGNISCQFTPNIDASPSYTESQNQINSLSIIPLFQCSDCKCILNKYCMVNKLRTSWICCICKKKNIFSNNISLPTDYIKTFQATQVIQFSLVDSNSYKKSQEAPTFFNRSEIHIILIDVVTDSQELNALKISINEFITRLPEHSNLLFLILDSDKVFINNKLSQSAEISFNKSSDLSINCLRKKLFQKNNDKLRITQFIYNIDVELELCLEYLNNISVSSQKKKKGERYTRITGKSLDICFSLLKLFKLEVLGIIQEKIYLTAKIIAFISGPCTSGPGKVIDKNLTVNFRNHSMLFERFSNLNKINISMQYYTDLARKNLFLLKGIDSNNAEFNQFCEITVTCDIYAANLDETGVFEMQELCNLTGGKILLFDLFESDYFHQNLMKESSHNTYSNSVLTILTSDNIKIKGAIGSLLSLNNRSKHASDVRIGEASTNQWLIGNLSSNLSTYHFVFLQEDFESLRLRRSEYYIQFQLKYSKGFRVITVFKKSASSVEDLVSNFDQAFFVEALAIELVYKNKLELKYDYEEIVKNLNRTLTNILKHFGRLHIKDCKAIQESSDFFAFISRNNLIKPNAKLEFLPQLFYYLERSSIIRKYNITPDESTFYNNIFLQYGQIEFSRSIILPKLYKEAIVEKDAFYEIIPKNEKPYDAIFSLKPVPIVSLVLSVAKDNIFIFDNFFHVLIHYGSNIAYYRDLFITYVSPNLKFLDLLTIDIENFVNNAIEDYRKRPKNIATLDPIVCLFDSVDFCSIFKSIKQARLDAIHMVRDIHRPIVPRFTETDENKSQARFLYSRLSPTDRYESENYFADSSNKMTEDVSLNDFYADVCKNIKTL